MSKEDLTVTAEIKSFNEETIISYLKYPQIPLTEWTQLTKTESAQIPLEPITAVLLPNIAMVWPNTMVDSETTI